MLIINILWNTTKHCVCQTLLNEVMPIDTWSNRLVNYFSNVWFLWPIFYCFLIFIGKFNNLFISESNNVVCLDCCWEYWESMLHICIVFKNIFENTGNFNFITWSCWIYKIIQDENFFLSWNTTWRNRSRSFLNGPFLIIAIYTKVIFKIEIFTLANITNSKHSFGFINWWSKMRSSLISTLITRKPHLFELGEYSGTLGHNTSNSNQSIQMWNSDIPYLVLNW